MSVSFFKPLKLLPVLAFSVLMAFAPLYAAQLMKDNTDEAWIDDDHPVIVELFTAANCAACMPADRILYDISRKKNVIALGCHINYWDSTTLKNPTGLEACTYRQWAYQSSGMLKETKIKVPHFMINGVESVKANKIHIFYREMLRVKENTKYKPSFIKMKWKDKQNLSITLPDSNRPIDDKDSFSVWLIRYQDSLIKKINIGENVGRVLRFTNVVKGAKHIAKWHGKERTIDVHLPAPFSEAERGGYVTIIHKMNGSEIIAAGKAPDYKLRKKKKAQVNKGKLPIKTPIFQQTAP